ncbi:membrane protein [Synergistales bacterium]|nr:membrane protein [Synergistales bacterium]
MSNDNFQHPTWIIVADDLTGACDTGIQFVRKGLGTIIVTEAGGELGSLSEKTQDAIVINTDSRNDDGATAAAKLFRIGEALKPYVGKSIFYKKVDSTLRGNIGAEAKALKGALGLDTVFFQPAYPQNGRTTVNGELRLNGVPVHLTDIAKDPLKPISTSSLKEILNESEDDFISCDVLTDDDMKNAIARVLETRSAENVLWVGSAGLASVLTDVLGKKKLNPPVRSGANKKRVGSILGLVGSYHPINIAQIEKARLDPNVTVIAPDVGEMTRSPQSAANAILRDILSAMEQKKDVLVVTAITPEQRDGSKRDATTSARIADFLSFVCRDTIQKTWDKELFISGLYMTGGEVASRVLQALDVSELVPMREIETGVPLLLAVNGSYNGLLVTKAGAFGGDESVIKILDALR